MKPITSSAALDNLIAAALDHQLTSEERTQFEAHLQTDPAARAAYEEAKSMHTLLEGSYAAVDPDTAFEQRMVSGVRCRLQQKQHTETPWESVLVLWRGLKRFPFPKKIRLIEVITVLFIMAILAGVALGPITSGIEKTKGSSAMQMARQRQLLAIENADELAAADSQQKTEVDLPALRPLSAPMLADRTSSLAAKSVALASANTSSAWSDNSGRAADPTRSDQARAGFSPALSTWSNQDGNTVSVGGVLGNGGIATPQGGTIRGSGFVPPAQSQNLKELVAKQGVEYASSAQQDIVLLPSVTTRSGEQSATEQIRVFPYQLADAQLKAPAIDKTTHAPSNQPATVPPTPARNNATPAPAEDPTRKLIRNAQLELEVKSFQTAIDGITALSREAGGYVDSSNSQRGGNGKLQGVIVIKVLPPNLDAVLLKLRELGDVRNQSVKTDDVTKDYYDTIARLDNSRKTEEQLQELLKRNNGKVADLLEVERELGRVRGEIEQMQGSLKFYDFLVQYATITIQLKEKDLNQAAAYLLQEQDNFSLFATDVEDTFKKARQAAEDCKAQILNATLTHNSGSDVSAQLVVMVPPDQIEIFLTQVRGLGRVADFTRQSQRVAKDGGDSDNPADQTLTEKDKVQVNLSIRSDDESRKQVALVVVTPAVDTALDQAKTAALANAGAEILESSLNKTAQGQSSGQLRVRVPGKNYQTLLDAFRALGRTASFSLQREDNSGPGANGDEAPVILSLALTDTDTPVQQTDLSIVASDVDDQAQQIKKDAATTGVEIKASNFSRQPDGRETAQMTFHLPMSKYPAFLESLKKLGNVESLTVNRADRPDQTLTDETAPAEINLTLHNQGDIVADNTGLWATLRQTFGEGAGALFTSIRTIGVLLAFLAPWVLTLAVLAWVARRLYLWRKK